MIIFQFNGEVGDVKFVMKTAFAVFKAEGPHMPGTVDHTVFNFALMELCLMMGTHIMDGEQAILRVINPNLFLVLLKRSTYAHRQFSCLTYLFPHLLSPIGFSASLNFVEQQEIVAMKVKAVCIERRLPIMNQFSFRVKNHEQGAWRF